MAIEYYSSIDLNKNELQNAVIQNAGSAPGSPSEGQIYYDSTSGDKALHFYNGSAWVRLAGQTTAQTTDTIASGDFIAFSDESETGDINNKLTVDNLFTTAPALLTEAAIADGDYIVFLDGGASGDAKKEALADLATLFAGTGLGASSSVLSIDAAQTGITSLLATDIKIGEDDQTKIDFEDADTINFYAANAKEMVLAANALTPGTSDGTALGTTSLMWSDLFLASGGVINFNNGDVAITHSSNNLNVSGGTLSFSFKNTDYTVTDGCNFVDSSDNAIIEFSDNAIQFSAAGTSVTGNLNVAADIIHIGDTNNKISFGTDTQSFETGGTARMNISDSGLQIGSGARVTTIENNDSLGTSDTKLATQGNVKAYVDANTGTNITSLGTISQDTVVFTSSNANDPEVQIKNTTNDASGARLTFIKDKGAAGADGDDIGVITFTGDDAAQTLTDFGKILVEVGEADNTDEAGKMTLQVASSDGTTTGLTSGLILTGHKTSDYVDVTLGSGASSTVTIPGNLVVTGETTTVNVTTTTTSNGVVFEGTTGDGHDGTLKSVVAGADVTYTLPNATGHVALFAADPSTTTISSTPAELNLLDTAEGGTIVNNKAVIYDGNGVVNATTFQIGGTAITSTAAEINLIDGGTSRGTTAVADGDGFLHNDGGTMRMTNVSKLADLFAGTNISASSSVLSVADASASAKGVVELATAAEVITGTATDKAVTADTLSAKSVVCDIDVSSLTDANIVTITHNLGTADILVQVYDKTTEANIMCDIARTTDDFSTASTSVVSIDFGTAPPNDCRALITSLAGATAGSIAYT